jgi:myosin-crossreactive antigen
MFYKFTKTVDEIMKELDFKQDELQDIKYMVITYHHVYLNYITSKIDDDFR